jgi:hypothetical protein
MLLINIHFKACVGKVCGCAESTETCANDRDPSFVSHSARYFTDGLESLQFHSRPTRYPTSAFRPELLKE